MGAAFRVRPPPRAGVRGPRLCPGAVWRSRNREYRGGTRQPGCAALSGRGIRLRDLGRCAPAVGNDDWALRTDRLSLRRALRRLLTQAGFSRVQAFYIDPSYHHPWGIIPARRGAVLVYERRQSARVGLRWWLAWLGLHPLLYGSHMFLAY